MLVRARYRDRFARITGNVRTFSAPSAAIYDAIASPVLDGFFTRVALELVAERPGARVLEIGSGPGRLASRIAEVARDAQVVGSDVAPAMIDRARTWSERSGVAARVRFVVADAGALPFQGETFDAVVSTLSLHHWPDAAAGLGEIRRVLRPGGVARIHDVADWINNIEPGGMHATNDALFASAGWARATTARLGPVPLLYTARLAR